MTGAQKLAALARIAAVKKEIDLMALASRSRPNARRSRRGSPRSTPLPQKHGKGARARRMPHFSLRKRVSAA